MNLRTGQRLLLLALILNLAACTTRRNITAEEVILAPLLTDNAILQFDEPITISGTTEANKTLRIRLESLAKYVKSDDRGQWVVTFPETMYRKPFNIYVDAADTTYTVKNIQIGKLWLIAGNANIESNYYKNYELQTDSVFNSVKHRLYSAKLAHETGYTNWRYCDTLNTKKDVMPFWLLSRLNHHENMPIGLVNLVHPGAKLHTWLPNDSINVGTLIAKEQAFFDTVTYEVPDTNLINKLQSAKYSDASWKIFNFPNKASRMCGLYDRLWMRKKVYTPRNIADSSLMLTLQNVNGNISLLFNDSILAHGYYNEAILNITIPRKLVKPWVNVLSVRTENLPGFEFNIDSVKLESTKDLAYNPNVQKYWRYSTMQESPRLKPRQTAETAGALHALYYQITRNVNFENVFWVSSLNAGDIDISKVDKCLASYQSKNKPICILFNNYEKTILNDEFITNVEFDKKLRSKILQDTRFNWIDIYPAKNVKPKTITEALVNAFYKELDRANYIYTADTLEYLRYGKYALNYNINGTFNNSGDTITAFKVLWNDDVIRNVKAVVKDSSVTFRLPYRTAKAEMVLYNPQNESPLTTSMGEILYMHHHKF